MNREFSTTCTQFVRSRNKRILNEERLTWWESQIFLLICRTQYVCKRHSMQCAPSVFTQSVNRYPAHFAIRNTTHRYNIWKNKNTLLPKKSNGSISKLSAQTIDKVTNLNVDLLHMIQFITDSCNLLGHWVLYRAGWIIYDNSSLPLF